MIFVDDLYYFVIEYEKLMLHLYIYCFDSLSCWNLQQEVEKQHGTFINKK